MAGNDPHRAMLATVKGKLERQGFSLSAFRSDLEVPNLEGARGPAHQRADLYARNGDFEILVKILTGDLDRAETATQMRAFSQWRAESQGKRRTLLVVPQADLERAKSALPEYDNFIGL